MTTIKDSSGFISSRLHDGVVLPRSAAPSMLEVLEQPDPASPSQEWWERLVLATSIARIPMDRKHAKAPVGGWAWAPRTLTPAMAQAWVQSMGEQEDVRRAYAALLDAVLPADTDSDATDSPPALASA